MAKLRVHELAKEFGMTSKEMLSHLEEMKIPAKNHASTLEEAYVDLVRKKLAPIMEARAAEIEAARLAEEQVREEEERKAAEEAERARIEAEERAQARREEERRRREEEEARRKAEEEARIRAEEEAAAEAERNRVKDTAPTMKPNMNNLLAQIQEERQRLEEEQARQAAEKKAEQEAKAAAAKERQSRAPKEEAPKKGKKGRRQEAPLSEEDRYAAMAREAERMQRNSVLDAARKAIEEAQTESTGRRQKRKEKREAEAAEREQERRIEEALAMGEDPAQLDVIRITTGSTVAEVAEALDVPANDIIKRLFMLGTPLTISQSMGDDLIELGRLRIAL